MLLTTCVRLRAQERFQSANENYRTQLVLNYTKNLDLLYLIFIVDVVVSQRIAALILVISINHQATGTGEGVQQDHERYVEKYCPANKNSLNTPRCFWAFLFCETTTMQVKRKHESQLTIALSSLLAKHSISGHWSDPFRRFALRKQNDPEPRTKN